MRGYHGISLVQWVPDIPDHPTHVRAQLTRPLLTARMLLIFIRGTGGVALNSAFLSDTPPFSHPRIYFFDVTESLEDT